MGKWPDFEYHGGKWIKYDRSSFNSSKATLGFCRRGSSENNKKLQCVKVKMEQGLVSPKRFRPHWDSCSMADTWVTVWGSHSVIKKRFEIPLLTLAPPGGVEVRYTITFMSYTVSDKQHLYTIFIINDICNVYICPWLNRLWLCSNWKLIFFSAAAAKIRFSYDGLNFVESSFSLLVFFHLSFLCWTSWYRLSLLKKLRRFWLPKVLRDTWKVISITINEMLFML